MVLVVVLIVVLINLYAINRAKWPVPWLNFADAYDFPQAAFDAYGDGNVILFHPGVYHIDDPLSVVGNDIKIVGVEGNKSYFNDTFMTINGERILVQGLFAERY